VWIDAILFWGGFAVVAGALGTVVGVVLAAQSIEAAGEISTALVAGGMKVALLNAVFGLMILFFSSVIWFGMQFRWRMLVAEEANGEAAA
jgi:biopolymer transport protein ExbB/TolQ